MFTLKILRQNIGEKVFYVEPERVFSSRSYNVLCRNSDGKIKAINKIAAPLGEKGLAGCRIFKQGLRLGVHNLLLLDRRSVLVSCKKKLLLQTGNWNDFKVVHYLRYGNKPALRGLCSDDDGLVYYGEYSVNRKRLHPVAVYRSLDRGRSFTKIFEFSPGEVRHIHFIQWDAFGGCLWMGTGDDGNECKILRSYDKGETWSLVGEGSQLWRSIGMVFTEKYLYWGTDAGGIYAGSWRNRIVRMDRESGSLTELYELPGPCHSLARLKTGLLVAATGVERGENEIDGRAHIFVSRDGFAWQDVASWRKDWLPLKISFGLIHFPHGLENSDELHFTLLGLRGGGEVYCVAKISEL